ncbi:hypothetical protein [Candidatus Leptofilum sp.]|uniref:hypothetical protein n=1 Tax=Candidatus Leptofilum sp. TaxID=3241576 RepID=UPI003B5B6688
MIQQPETNQLDETLSHFAVGLGFGAVLGFLLIVLARLPIVSSFSSGTFSQWLAVDEQTAWHIVRASGTVAYVLLTWSTIWGLLLSTKIIKEWLPAALSLGMHKIVSWLAIGLTGLHAVALLFDNFYSYTVADLLIPFTGPYAPGWVGLGVISLYIMVLTSLSFSWRKRIGQTWWRRLHALNFLAYGGATIHGMMAGTDSTNLGMQGLYWGSGLGVLFLTNYRLLVAVRGNR